MGNRDQPGGSLARRLKVAIALVGGAGLICAIALVSTSRVLHHSITTVTNAVESVRLAEDIQVQALLHARVNDPVVRADVERALEDMLNEAGRHVGSQREQAALDDLRLSVRGYLAGAQDAPIERSFALAHDLALINLEQARAEQAGAARWDLVVGVVGVTVAVLLVGVLVFLWVWLRRSALRPVQEMAQTMARVQSGDLGARLPEQGLREFREIAAQFNAMTQALDARRQGRLAFIGAIAHDMRNPLSAISMSLANLSRDESGREERFRRTLPLLRRQVGRLERLTGDLVEAAQLEAGRLELHLEPTDVRGVARDACELLEGTSPQHQIECQLPPEPVWVSGDPTRLHQILSNLVGNAIKYSPSGGRVGVRVERTQDAARVSVADEGPGVPVEEQPFVFDPFRRASQAHRSGKGAGLGLFISSSIARAHGGHIELASPGGGAVFTLVLPLLQPERGVVVQAAGAADAHPAAFVGPAGPPN